EYEDLTADIYYKDEFVAMLSQENGFENLEIEISAPKEEERWVFNFKEFEEVLSYAKKRLWELRKLPDNDSQ
ncbi:MAG: hypothetical protein L7U87_00120, partial [Chlamydiales bacterium]|nr:hypothetical protein [Chlamydiales bacterium]